MSKIVLFVVFVFSVNLAASQNSFESVYKANERPHKENIRIYFNDDGGNTGYLPISIIKGKNEGPVFTVLAGVHGFEYPPIVAAQRLMEEIDMEELRGTLVIVPVANTASFFTRTPFVNPQDQKNLNNAFPGKVDGSITEQIAHYISTNIIPVSDVLLDVHGGDACEDLIPFVCFYNNEQRPEQTALAKKLSENSGFELVVSYPYTLSDTDPAKYAFKQAVQDGKTALSIECGKLGNVQDDNVELILKGIHNMLAEMNMYDNGSGPHERIIHGTDQTYINSSVQGIFYSGYKAGDQVEKDAVVGYTTDEFGKVLEEYRAPKDGVILYKLATPPINIDDTVMCITSITENE
ncbi:succinylglutamate desuccinylase/aspartoacylase family protein [Pseudozobellia thermophila]|uniref:Succinylglutamate desuccinylase/Aspartoacylase catalytic domain-containing protein n=1 Tax=Pseudozobellia thermophila TaxID=192903 RepID=A0A1M6NS59_9FLAO|nr:M14 family metallopeptidase [Pseudozobellia thermophila]SHJ98559.1 hypothetical protein SAMN04488513_11524 [Pseudozobellia thermophila]